MINKLPNLKIKHHRIENPHSSIWNLIPLVYEGGCMSLSRGGNDKTLKTLDKLALKNHQIIMVQKFKDHAEDLLSLGYSLATVANYITSLKGLFIYLDENRNKLDSVDNVRQALFDYSEYQYSRANLKKIKHQSAYSALINISLFLNGVYESLNFQISQTRLRRKARSQRVLSREAEKVTLTDARKLANFCYEITQNFDPTFLRSGALPFLIKINNQEVNLTPGKKKHAQLDLGFKETSAYLAFNYRVTAEVFIFLAMTIQNQAPTYNLKRRSFAFKPINKSYEIREFKNRRGGEVLFKIPEHYKPHFEKYLSFLDEYAPESDWLFPYLEKYKGFRKRSNDEINKFQRLCYRYKIPWVKPSAFRKIGENILLRLANDEQTAADYANHAISTFKESYEFSSLQRSMIEIGRFWAGSDPLVNGEPKVSLFNSPCNGVPMQLDDATNKLPQPDCITPTGCIGCKHYRDEESFDYVWGLHSFKFLKIIESSSHRTNKGKPSHMAIEWVNLKIDWFKKSENLEYHEWVQEASMKIEEGDYHPTWSRKIKKFVV